MKSGRIEAADYSEQMRPIKPHEQLGSQSGFSPPPTGKRTGLQDSSCSSEASQGRHSELLVFLRDCKWHVLLLIRWYPTSLFWMHNIKVGLRFHNSFQNFRPAKEPGYQARLVLQKENIWPRKEKTATYITNPALETRCPPFLCSTGNPKFLHHSLPWLLCRDSALCWC